MRKDRISSLLRPCVECGELTEDTRCDAHQPKRADHHASRQARGYDEAWQKLSARARRLQPFCSVHGCTSTDLTVDHTPEAWRRKEQGKPIRLEDVEVLCRSHNSVRGAARGEKNRR